MRPEYRSITTCFYDTWVLFIELAFCGLIDEIPSPFGTRIIHQNTIVIGETSFILWLRDECVL
jgi:hypothetical protein